MLTEGILQPIEIEDVILLDSSVMKIAIGLGKQDLRGIRYPFIEVFEYGLVRIFLKNVFLKILGYEIAHHIKNSIFQEKNWLLKKFQCVHYLTFNFS